MVRRLTLDQEIAGLTPATPAIKHGVDMDKFKEVIEDLKEQLNKITYSGGDLSDVGNEIGLVIGKHLKNEIGYEKESFISGFNHGLSLIDGTH